ncbi:MAG TPA: TonB-dependent receptor [Thermoanaerobaculia bacterium]|nr:TonB-dependent receptor [Thermoanaerobaculia bacterium]
MRVDRLALALAALGALLGQEARASSSGKLIGTVKDPAGEALPGVTVTASSPALIGGARSTRTGADGSFLFPSLDPGLYRVKAELSGFRSIELAKVRVFLDRTTAVFPRLEAGELAEQLTVTAEPPVLDPLQVATGQVFTAEFMDRSSIGADDRLYQSVIGSAAGVGFSELNSDPHVFGSTVGENVYLIDGLDTTDPFTATLGTNFNFDAIQEISFFTAGFEAEYGRATGGVVNLITKSGGNSFSGTFDTRYRTSALSEKGPHFDPSRDKSTFILPAATLGGPVLLDRLWFFTSAEYQEQATTPFLSPTANTLRGEDYLGKLSWQIDPQWRAVFKASSTPFTNTNFNASQFVEPAAAATERQSSVISQGELSATLGSNLLWELQAGVNRRRIFDAPASGDLATPGVFDQATQISSVNAANVQSSTRERAEGQTSLTWFAAGPAAPDGGGWGGGGHEFKAGFSYGRLALDALNNTVGGASYVDDSSQGGPFLFSVTPVLPAKSYTGDLAAAYLQDGWRLLPSLTVKLGLRYDAVGYHNEAGNAVANLSALQPRFGFAWDLLGDAHTLLRGSYGRFMHPSALSLPFYARLSLAPTTRYVSCSDVVAPGVADPAQVAALCRGYATAHGGAVIADPLHRDPAGYAFFDVLSSMPNRVDPRLQPAAADELTLGLQRQLASRSSIELTYVYKKTRHILEDTCSENVPTPTADPGLVHCPYLVMTNPAAARRDYHGLLLRFETRAADRLYLVASYAYSLSRGSVEYTQGSGPDFDVFPVHFVNTYGFLSDDRRHRLKVKGFVKLPLGFSAGFNALYESPFSYSVLQNLDPPLYGTQFLEPRGSRRANSSYTLELELRKAFRLGPLSAELIGTIENVLSSQRPTAVCQFAGGCGGDTSADQVPLGAATDFQQPRRYEVGLRLVF